MNTTSTENETEKMIRAGAFNPDDLMFNQMGELSPRQRGWLMLEIAGWACQMMIHLTFIIAAWVGFYLQFHWTGYFVLGGTLWSVLLVVGIGMCVGYIQPIWRSLKDNEVQAVAGKVSKRALFRPPSLTRRGSGGYWALIIRSYRFSISSRIFDVIIEQNSYRIFYIPALKRLVNIEPLFSEEPPKKSALAALQAQAKEKEQSHE